MRLPEDLLSNLQGLVADTQQLIQSISDQSENRILAARDRARHAVECVRQDLAAYARVGASRTREAGMAADRYVHDHAWSFIAGAALLALALGAVLASGRHRDSTEDQAPQ